MDEERARTALRRLAYRELIENQGCDPGPAHPAPAWLRAGHEPEGGRGWPTAGWAGCPPGDRGQSSAIARTPAIRRDRADGPPADGRGRLRQDGGRGPRDAASGRQRCPGGDDGPDRGPRHPALLHPLGHASRDRGGGGTADRLDKRGRPEGNVRRLAEGRIAIPVGTHALLEGPVRLQANSPSRLSTRNTASGFRAAAGPRRWHRPDTPPIALQSSPRRSPDLALTAYGDLDDDPEGTSAGREPGADRSRVGGRRAMAFERPQSRTGAGPAGIRGLPAGRGVDRSRAGPPQPRPNAWRPASCRLRGRAAPRPDETGPEGGRDGGLRRRADRRAGRDHG